MEWGLQERAAHALCISPLLLAHFIMPLMTEPSQPPPWRTWLPALPLSSERKRELCFSEANLDQGRWSCVFTSMFVHQDSSHCTGNALALYFASRRTFRSFGTLGVWLTFLCSGVAGVLNTTWTRDEFKSGLTRTLAAPESWYGARLVNRASESAVALAAPKMHRYVSYLGSSDGVTGLMGASFVVSLFDLLQAIGFGHPLFDYSTSCRGRRNITRSQLQRRVLVIASDLGLSSLHIMEDVMNYSQDRVSHAGHLTGFFSGVVCALSFVLFKRTYQYVQELRMNRYYRH